MIGDKDVVAEGWIDTRTAAEVSGYRRAHVRYLAIHGKVEGRKIGRDWFVRQDSLLQYKALAGPGGRPRQEVTR